MSNDSTDDIEELEKQDKDDSSLQNHLDEGAKWDSESYEVAPWWHTSAGLSFFFKHQKFFVGLMICIFTLLLGAGLIISQITATHGLIVFGSHPHLWSVHRKVALRIEAHSLPLHQKIKLKSARIYFVSPIGERTSPQVLKQKIGTFLQGTVKLPHRESHWKMIIEAEPESRDLITLYAQLPIDLRSSFPPPPLLELAETPHLAQAKEGDGNLSFFAADQRLSFELNSDLFLVAEHPDGTPWRGTFQLERRQGLSGVPLPSQVKTDQDGLALFTVIPRSPNLQLNATSLSLINEAAHGQIENTQHIDNESEETPTVAYKRLFPMAHQFTLYAQSQHIGGGGRVSFKVKSSVRVKQLFFDLWWGDVWIETKVIEVNDNEGYLRIDLPHTHLPLTQPHLLWAQVYKNPYLPGDIRGGTYLLYEPSSKKTSSYTKLQLGEWLKNKLIKNKVEPESYWPMLSADRLMTSKLLRLGLGRFKRPQTNPQIIIDSGSSAQEMVYQMRAQYQRWFFIAMSVMYALICSAIGWLMWSHYKSMIAHPLLADLYGGQHMRRSTLRWFFFIVVTLLSFFGGMIFLVFTIRW